jgi:3-phosphoshikimate 1-carboxyvinyltransferase
MVPSEPMPKYLGEKLAVEPLARTPCAAVRVPGSKSITNRALILGTLASDGTDCELRGALRSEDTEVMVSGLQDLGIGVEACWPESLIRIFRRTRDGIPAAQADLFVANSGTTMRFLTALVSLGEGRYRLDGVARMRQRPIGDLLDALKQFGVRARSECGNGFPPVIVEAHGLPGGNARIRGEVSSQFLSGLLLVAARARSDVTLEVEGALVSEPYVAMTVAMLRQWGLHLAVGDRTFHIPSGQPFGLRTYEIEPDASAASYFWAAAAITGGRVRVEGLTAQSIQGDVRFVDVLENMGCGVVRSDTGLTVQGGPLRGTDVDMNDISDTVMTLAAVALFAEGPTTIRNVAHIRHKETDRLAALGTELRRLGAGVDEFADGLTITPRPLHGAELETYDDHRMAMSLALVGLRVPGVVVKDPGCVAKTYPDFFADLEALRC